jgi:hypothetical protein
MDNFKRRLLSRVEIDAETNEVASLNEVAHKTSKFMFPKLGEY